MEFDDNVDVCLADLGIIDGSRLMITNEYDEDPLKEHCLILILKQSELEEFKIHGSIKLITRPKIITQDVSNESSSKRKRMDEEIFEGNKKLKEILVDDDTIIL